MYQISSFKKIKKYFSSYRVEDRFTDGQTDGRRGRQYPFGFRGKNGNFWSGKNFMDLIEQIINCWCRYPMAKRQMFSIDYHYRSTNRIATI